MLKVTEIKTGLTYIGKSGQQRRILSINGSRVKFVITKQSDKYEATNMGIGMILSWDLKRFAAWAQDIDIAVVKGRTLQTL